MKRTGERGFISNRFPGGKGVYTRSGVPLGSLLPQAASLPQETVQRASHAGHLLKTVGAETNISPRRLEVDTRATYVDTRATYAIQKMFTAIVPESGRASRTVRYWCN